MRNDTIYSPQKFSTFLMKPVDASSLAAFRLVFGFIMAYYIYAFRDAQTVQAWYVEAKFFFTFSLLNFLGLEPLSGTQWYFLFAVIGISAAWLAVGLFYRFSLGIFTLSFLYMFLIEKSYYNNHYYLILLICFLMFFMGAHRCFSVDAFFTKKLSTQRVPFWNIFILRAQIIILYFFGAVTKMTPDWLSGVHLRTWLGARTHYPILGQFFGEEWFIFFFSYAGLIFDLTIGFLLCYRPTRWIAFGFVLFFHLMNKWLFDILVFHYIGIASLILFLDPDHPRRALNALLSWFKMAPMTLPKEKPQKFAAFKSAGIRNSVCVFVLVYLLIQMAVPLRHWLYPGDVSWTHEGQRFAWRIVSNEIKVDTVIYAGQAGEDDKAEVNYFDDLNYQQALWMGSRPGMIIQYVHYLKDKLQKTGEISDPEITVQARVGLNGRPLALLVDPTVNLAQEDYPALSHASWILPHPDLQKTNSPIFSE